MAPGRRKATAVPFTCQNGWGTTGNGGDWHRGRPEFQRISAAGQPCNHPYRTRASQAEVRRVASRPGPRHHSQRARNSAQMYPWYPANAGGSHSSSSPASSSNSARTASSSWWSGLRSRSQVSTRSP